MQKHFLQAMEKIEGLINLWSAPYADLHEAPNPENGKVLVAVSGGVDSMCLADLFLKNYGPDRFAIAHCNFRLRGEESDGDEALVRGWAQENGVRCYVKSFDTEEYAVKEGISIEMAARDLRYEWFDSLCLEHGYAAVAVAHNANDNAETLILNLLRGTGVDGLCGMSRLSELPTRKGAPALIRPILSCTRKMIEGYAFAHGIRYREDSSNTSSDYKRNRIRNEVFPIFEKINPSFVRTLNREMGYFNEVAQIVDDYCESNVQPSVIQGEERNLCSVPQLLSHKHWRYLLYYMLEPYGFNSATVASVEDLLESGRTVSGKRFESDEYELVIERTDICVRSKRVSSQQDVDLPVGMPDMNGNLSVMTVHGPGIYNFNGRRYEVETMPYTSDMPLKQPEGVLLADASRLTFPFVCRKWRQGDWMIPFGMKGRKKISDIFADIKYTSIQKEQAVMIVDCKGELAQQQHVAGILGWRMDNRYRITSETETIIRITIL